MDTYVNTLKKAVDKLAEFKKRPKSEWNDFMIKSTESFIKNIEEHNLFFKDGNNLETQKEK